MKATGLRTENSVTVRDLNKNGILDPYEDPSRPIEERVEDLLSRMTLEEKAGMLFHTAAIVNPKGGPFPGLLSTEELVLSRLMNHFNIFGGDEPRKMAEWNNDLQKTAEGTRLGIPVTISTDPRHAFTDNPATSMSAGAFSV